MLPMLLGKCVAFSKRFYQIFSSCGAFRVQKQKKMFPLYVLVQILGTAGTVIEYTYLFGNTLVAVSI